MLVKENKLLHKEIYEESKKHFNKLKNSNKFELQCSSQLILRPALTSYLYKW